MKRTAAAVFTLAALAFAPGPARAQDVGVGIIAVVNDNVITSIDLMQRIRLAEMSSGLPDNAEVRAHLAPQILRTLIDEQLELQEAKKQDLTVTDAEIDSALAHIAHDNHISGDMRDFIAAHGASPDSLVHQVRAEILWGKVVQRELRPHIEVGDDEVDAVIDRIRANAGKEEYLVSDIFLPVDNAKDEDQVHQLADRLVDQLRHGANFAAIAHQFSQDASAAQGGDIGWIQQGQLAPQLDKALVNAKPGELSAPIRTATGFHILGVRDRRTVSLGAPEAATVNLRQAFHPYARNAGRDALMAQAGDIRNAVKSCDALGPALAQHYPGWTMRELGDMNPAKAPAFVANPVRGLAVGEASQPLATDKGVALLFVCGRNDGGGVDRNAIMHSIGTQKLELQARSLLRDLRQSAYIDIRIGKKA